MRAFFKNGVVSEFSRLQLNTRISIRAGRGLTRQVEVYPFIWGSVTPR